MANNPQPRSLLQARNISMAFGGLVVFSNISLDITEHQIVALIGPNGAGKTTLINNEGFWNFLVLWRSIPDYCCWMKPLPD